MKVIDGTPDRHGPERVSPSASDAFLLVRDHFFLFRAKPLRMILSVPLDICSHALHVLMYIIVQMDSQLL